MYIRFQTPTEATLSVGNLILFDNKDQSYFTCGYSNNFCFRGCLFKSQKNIDREIENIIHGNLTTTQNITDTILRTTDLLAVQTALNQDVQNFFLLLPDNNRKISNTYQKIREYILAYIGKQSK